MGMRGTLKHGTNNEFEGACLETSNKTEGHVVAVRARWVSSYFCRRMNVLPATDIIT